MSTRVCVLASWEVDGLIESRRLPDCQHHHHIKITEASEMVNGSGLYARAVAEWVGPGERRIAMLTDFDYKPKHTGTGHVVFNRVER